ncbi:MAG: hypothetical protein QW041_02710 [Candidatus Pacearchaeota archaeon]
MGELDELIAKINPRYKEPVWENELNYETTIDNLQPIYFWIIDFAKNFFSDELTKTKDNFMTSPGSSYFAELGQRATRMQEESIKILGYVNTLIKSIVNLIYDLKEFEMLFNDYNNAKSTDPKVREMGILGLKQRWLSTVDSKRGMGSIDNMTHQYGFTLLRPAFMAAVSPEAVDSMDLNEIVKRVLKPRVAEFFEWVKLSEKELRKRYEIEKSYLKSQVNTLKLYTEWVKPYLTAAEELRMKGTETPSLVSVFGTMILELELIGKSKFNVVDAVIAKDLPIRFKNLKLRNYNKIGIINFSFRTFPTQQAMHSGKVTINFKAYALNDDELCLLKYLKKEKDLKDIFAVTAVTTESLEALKEDIERYTKKDEEEKKPKEEGLFSGILSDFKERWGVKKKEKKEKTPEEIEKEEEEKGKMLKEKGIPPDSYEESIVRELTELESASICFKIYDVFKKSRGMASFPNPFDEPDVLERLRLKRAEVQAILKSKGEL